MDDQAFSITETPSVSAFSYTEQLLRTGRKIFFFHLIYSDHDNVHQVGKGCG